MEQQIVGYIATGIVSLEVGYLLQRFQSRPKLLHWIPGSFLFELQHPALKLQTDSLTIQNTGKVPASDIEIIHRQRPDHFQFSTPISFKEQTTPTGQHIIRLQSLGANEFVNLQLLSHKQVPVLENVRSAEGPSQLIEVVLQRRWPKPIQALAGFMLLIGFGFAVYWFSRVTIFLSEAIGIL